MSLTFEKINRVMRDVLKDTYLEAHPVEVIDTAFYSNWGLDDVNLDMADFFARTEKLLASEKSPDRNSLNLLIKTGRSVVPFSIKEKAWSRLARDTMEHATEVLQKENHINALVLYAGFAAYKEGEVNFVEELRNAFYSSMIEKNIDVEKSLRKSLVTIIDRDERATRFAKEQILQYFPNIRVEVINTFDILGLKKLLMDMKRREFYHLVVNTSLFGKHPFANQFYQSISLLLKPGHKFFSANSHHALWKSPHITLKLLEHLEGANVELFKNEILPYVPAPERLFDTDEEKLQTEIAITYYVRLNKAFREYSRLRGKKVIAPNKLLDSTTTSRQKIEHMRNAFFSTRMAPLVRLNWNNNNVTFMYAMEGVKKS